ncbi:MAG: FAD binding domain-containing protein [Deltaproteobacteria bacterium]|nr:FAD binding domain-containing protein [Deltaproteobacteria bacterium]
MHDLHYERPRTTAEACGLLAAAKGRAMILAGGTDLQIRLRDQPRAGLIVDIKKIPELCSIRPGAAGALEIGSAVTLRALIDDPTVGAAFPALALAALAVGSFQVRGRATLGGNLCNASPCMDTAPVLLLLGASLRLQSARGSRELPLTRFFTGVKRTLLEPDELCTTILIPAAARRLVTAFGKVKRVQGHDLALVNAAVSLDPEAETLGAAIGSAATTPVVCEPLTGVSSRSPDAALLGDALAGAALKVIQPIDDVRASAEYRRDMTAMLCRRLVREVVSGRRAS